MFGLACPSSITTLGCGGPPGASIQVPQVVWGLEDWVQRRGLSHGCLRRASLKVWTGLYYLHVLRAVRA